MDTFARLPSLSRDFTDDDKDVNIRLDLRGKG